MVFRGFTGIIGDTPYKAWKFVVAYRAVNLNGISFFVQASFLRLFLIALVLLVEEKIKSATSKY